MIKLQLHENWQLCNIRQLDWIPAQIPGGYLCGTS